MINKKIETAFNKQINEEIYSSYLYLSMAAYLETLNLPGFRRWMKLQAQEEMFHAMKFFNHIAERGGQVKLLALKQPESQWKSVLDVFQAALKHEYHITKCINDLMDEATAAKDYAAQNLLKWFVDEQVEEEANFTEKVGQLKMIGQKLDQLYLMDKDMATRVPGLNPFIPFAEQTPNA